MVAQAILRAERATRRLAGDVPVTLVSEIDIEVRPGELVSITGPSGSGKSSALYLLGLLDRPSEGRVLLRERDTSLLSDDELADTRLREIGFVFQFHFLLPEFSALENVMLPMQRLGRLAAAEMRERAEALLVRLGLEQHVRKLPKQLSGGQSQRVAIARALANEPAVLLADEPTGNLDTASSAAVQRILRELAGSDERAVVVVTHDPHVAELADRRIHIVDGRVASAP